MLRFAPRYLAWTSLIHLSNGQSFIGDEELVILVTLESKTKSRLFVSLRSQPKFDFDENAESNRCLARRITEYMVERFAKLVPLFSMVYTHILIMYSRLLRSP